MAAIPTRIKQNIRDQITFPASSWVTQSTALSKTLGYPVIFDPEWGMLWSTLKPYYPDPGTFIPSMVIILKAWVEAFTTWLEDEGNEEAVDRMLGALKDVQGLMLALEIAPGKEGKEQRPSTAWSSKKSTFLLLIPKAEPSHASTILAGFASNLLELFTQSPSASPVLSSRAAATAEDPDHDSWAHLSLDSPQSEPQFAPPRKPASSASPLGPNSESEYLPEISAIQRPEEMTKKPPYWLIVRQEGKTRITVEASHGPSLVVLEGWLRKWCRGDTSRMNRPPVIEIKLLESPFGLGLMHDTLILEATRGREVSATLVLAFVQNELGYENVIQNGSLGSVWEFKRLRGFK